MNEKKNTKIEKEVGSYIKDKSEYFPFMYQFCDINVNKKDLIKKNKEMVQFGHYGTEEKHSVPFYKPYSKIINFAIIDE